MAQNTAADALVRCLESEGVERVFGIPGEETLDLSRALDRSDIQFIPVRHEQAGAYMANVVGRLTGRAGVCLTTLGPGATNTTTAIADAFLDRAPLVLLTGQSGLERMHKESHQYIDVIGMMRPITKWNARVSEPGVIPEVVRKAFKVAEAEKPGPTHLELPEDVMAAPLEAAPLPRRSTPPGAPPDSEIARAAGLIMRAASPVILAGNGVVRGRAAAALRDFAHATGIGVAETFMAKGVLDADDPLSRGAVGLQAGDYRLAGFAEADLVLAVGFDLVEHSPRNWNPNRDKLIVCIDSMPAEIDECFIPEVELAGDISEILQHLSRSSAGRPQGEASTPLQDSVRDRIQGAPQDPDRPLQPVRVLYEIRQAMGPRDILVSDVGLHKLWIGRVFPAHEPGTCLIANGLAAMGFAVPAAIAAKLVHPDRKVVQVSGDGGFMMNAQDLETAVRLKTAFVSVVWENNQFGSIVWKQMSRFGTHFGTNFGNPDFVAFAASFGMPAPGAPTTASPRPKGSFSPAPSGWPSASPSRGTSRPPGRSSTTPRAPATTSASSPKSGIRPPCTCSATSPRP